MRRIAVIGSGISGISSAYLLSKKHVVDIYEASPSLGGHTRTLTPDGIAVDTGFIVFNQKNYPHFEAFLTELGIETSPSDMSFSVTAYDKSQYWGSDVPFGLFANKKNLIFPAFYRFLWGTHRFNQHCLQDLANNTHLDQSLGQYLKHHAIDQMVVDYYILPMTSAIWSGSFRDVLAFPMRTFIQFWHNHQLLEIGKGLPWKTLKGGSRRYLDKASEGISGSIHLNSGVERVSILGNDQVQLYIKGQPMIYDAVVIATHADQALSLLAEPTSLQTKLLKPWQYSNNTVCLHTDPSVMPPHKRAWSSWNLRRAPNNADHLPVCVTYWMNRLQPLNTPTNYFVTLNPLEPIAPNRCKNTTMLTHPIMNQASIDTQAQLPLLNEGSRVVFCGSYFGHGFHEDGLRSAIESVKALQITLA